MKPVRIDDLIDGAHLLGESWWYEDPRAKTQLIFLIKASFQLEPMKLLVLPPEIHNWRRDGSSKLKAFDGDYVRYRFHVPYYNVATANALLRLLTLYH